MTARVIHGFECENPYIFKSKWHCKKTGKESSRTTGFETVAYEVSNHCDCPDHHGFTFSFTVDVMSFDPADWNITNIEKRPIPVVPSKKK